MSLSDALIDPEERLPLRERLHLLGVPVVGPEALEPLKECLAGRRRREWTRVTAVQGLVEVAGANPSVRAGVVAALAEEMGRYVENGTYLNAWLVHGLVELKATEAAETIERAHAADRVDTSLCGPWNTVKRKLGVQGLGLVPPHLAGGPGGYAAPGQPKPPPSEQPKPSPMPTVVLPAGPAPPVVPEGLYAPDIFNVAPQQFQNLPSSPTPAQPVRVQPHARPEPLRAEARASRNDPCPCGSGRKYKKCCGG